MERLWTPWRHAYVTRKGEPPGACVLCDALEQPDGRALLVHEGAAAYVILNRYPYNSGHLMVVPRRHVAALADLAPAEWAEVATLVQLAERALTDAYAPEGINVGMNLGRPAGAGVADHLHVHLVPRWTGDTSFISVVGDVRVLPEQLSQSVQRLRPVFARLAGS